MGKLGEEMNLKSFDLLESLKTDDYSTLEFSDFLNNDTNVSSPESFTSENDDYLKDIKDLSPLIKEEKDMDFIQNFLTNDKNKIEVNEKKNNKRKRMKNEEVVEEKESLVPEKDVKRQIRLIKNRESAQASRERRKTYVKGLEDTVKNLNTKNTSLNSKCLTLEEENQKLREQLQKACNGEKIEPVLKKQKLNTGNSLPKKLPLPPLQQMPFLTTQFWNGFFSGGNSQTTTNNQQIGTTPKVVLFIALFCVALFLVKPEQNGFDEKIEHKNIGRIIQQAKETINSNEGLPKEVRSLYAILESLGKDEYSSKIQESIGKIKLKFDTKSENVTFSFPKIKEEEVNEITVSKSLFSEICSKLTEVETK